MAYRWLRLIVPEPRRPITGRDAAPLIVFVAVFVLAIGALMYTRAVLFGRPAAFALSASLIWFWWLHVTGFHGLSGLRNVSAQLARYALIAVLITVLAEPRSVRENDDLSVVYVLDVSDSVGKIATTEGLKYILATANDRPDGDRAGLVILGGDAAVELPPTESFPFEAIKVQVPRDDTNIGKALALSAALVPLDTPGRIVLISDGVSPSGDTTGVLDECKARDLPVDVLPVQYDITEEVWIERLGLPVNVKRGETYQASVLLSSLTAGGGQLVLFENDEEIAREAVTYSAGKNRFTLPIYLRSPGYYTYRAEIIPAPGRDTRRENNIGINYIYLKGQRRILLVTDPLAADDADYRYLAQALAAAEAEVQPMTSFEMPYSALELMPYDCIVLCNVAADSFDYPQLQAIQQAVFRQGQGLLMIGGENSFGPGGYRQTPVETALPVTMDITMRRVMPKAALAIVLHTCEFPNGNTWGKNITKAAIRVLGERDEACVLAYSYQGGVKFVCELTPISEYDEMARKISAAQIGDMPSFSPTMEMGLKALSDSDAAARHMIVISDGDPQPPAPSVLDQFVTEKISVSTVSIFPHGNVEVSIMQAIAAATGGRYYFPQDPNQLPSIFIKEAKTLRRNLIQNKTFYPTMNAYSAIMKGITEVSPLHGYTLTTPKDRAVTILRGPDKEALDPVLAVWQHGLGRTAAFTSDLTARWGRDWVASANHDQFVKQLFEDISRVEKDSHLTVQSWASGPRGKLVVQDSHPDGGFLELTASVLGPNGADVNVDLRQTAPGRYEAEYPLSGVGHYHLLVTGSAGERAEMATASLIIPYSAEYLRFRGDLPHLQRIADRTGGRILLGDESAADIFPATREVRRSTQLIIDWFLIALSGLLLADVAIRRVQIGFRQWLPKRRGKTQADGTIGSLLARKRNLRPETRPATLGRASRSPRPVSEATARRPSPQAEPTEPAESEQRSTAGALLKKKKRWEKENE